MSCCARGTFNVTKLFQATQYFRTFLGSELVPGDIVRISTGDRVPADVRLINAVDLEVDESSLTGETKPMRKDIQPTYRGMGDAVVPISDRKNICFMGTLVRSGNGLGVVVGTGKETEFGEIWLMMKEVDSGKTPLQEKMDELGKFMSYASFGIIGMITLLGLIQGRGWLETFTIGVSLAVAAIPEGLPIVVTVTLALGVIRMSKKNAIVKRLPSVESLGSVNVVCADKTGTLTMNSMTVTQIFTVGDGNLFTDKNADLVLLSQRPTVSKLLQIACLCNNSHLRTESNQEPVGSPTEIALLKFAEQCKYKDSRTDLNRSNELPFTSETKMMAVQYETQNGSFFFVKGAADSVVPKCRRYFNDTEKSELPVKMMTQDVRQHILSSAHQTASLGLRVLVLAYGVEINDLIFVGFVAMQDPPRKGVAECIHTLHASGVDVVMITGDAEQTAVAIGRQLGIFRTIHQQDEASLLMSGSQIETHSEEELASIVGKVKVFYRTTPRHKLKIVKAYQTAGNIVAMTGDGVNDAPALKLADIGIAMGKTGTDVCKEAADMILVNDDVTTIISAIEEGKSIFYNIRNFLRFQLSTSVSALTLIALSTLFSLPPPLNAMQILWINIIMDGPPAQSLGVEPVDHDVMKKPPRRKNEAIIDKDLIIRVLTSALFVVGGTLFIYRSEMEDGAVTAKDTTMTFTTFVMFDMFNALSCRSEKKSILSIGFTSNKPFLYAVSASIFCQLCVIYIPFFQAIFQTVPLSFGEVFKILILSSSVWVFDEVRKYYTYRAPLAKGYERVQ